MNVKYFFKWGLIIKIIFLSFTSNSQIIDDSTYYERLFFLCKAWGHVKYYHSEIAKGSINWDDKLIEAIEDIKTAESNSDYNTVVEALINSAGTMEISNAELPQVPDSLNNNLDLDWIYNPIFSDTVSAMLDTIFLRFRPQSHVLIDVAFENGNPTFDADNQYYDDESFYPTEEKRLLALFRYWNIIHYFYPYKNIMDQKWDTTLYEFIPRIVDASSALSYHLAFKELTTRLNDSHGFLYSPVINYWQGGFFPPFQVRYIEDEMVITKINEGITLVHLGDIIKEIDGRDIYSLRDNFRPFAQGSNEAFIERNLNDIILWGDHGSFQLKIDHGSGTLLVGLNRDEKNFELLNESRRPEWRKITGENGCNVGIINMGILEPDQVEDMFNSLWDTDAIIFDVRNYPRGSLWEIVNYLYPSSITIAQITVPDITYPGRLYWESADMGTGTSNPYAGKVIILFDERTMSQAEFTVMGLEQFPNAIKIGSTTAAADGNISQIQLPGGIITYATFLGVYYPDYSPTQRIGILPDYEVYPTISGIRSGKDELIEFAFDYLNCDLITEIEPEIITNNSEIRIYPNPVHHTLNFEFLDNYSGTIKFEICNLQGQRIKIIDKNMTSGILNLSDLRSGIYIIKIITSNNKLSKTIIKN